MPVMKSHPLECHHQVGRSEEQRRSASDLLRSYIDQFDRSGTQGPLPPLPPLPPVTMPQRRPPAAGGWEKRLVELPATGEDRDTLELLCGGRGDCLTEAYGGALVGVKTRRILQDVDKQLGHFQPCYSAPDKLDLRTMWPSMHEHLERRWRHQLRARYEARLKEEAAAAAAAAAVQGSRAGMYEYRPLHGSRRGRSPTLPKAAQRAATHDEKCDDSADEDDDDEDTEEAEGGSVGGDGGSLAESPRLEAAHSEKGGRPCGSDSGVGLSCGGGGGRGADEKPAKPDVISGARAVDADDADAAIDDDDDEEVVEGHRSFEERMRSYRCVLEAHEMSTQLRQRLEVACAASGPHALSSDQKGRIRDRLVRLQYPELPVTAGEGPPGDAAATAGAGSAGASAVSDDSQAQDERISTERLTRLMRSARGLLATSDDRLRSCRQLCDSLGSLGGGGEH